jgi:hypothetical protein
MDANEDPFDAVHAEARAAWAAVSSDADRWRTACGTHDIEVAAAAADAVRARLRALEWDLQDLDEAVRVAAARPHAFGLTKDRVDARRRAVAELREAAASVLLDVDGGNDVHDWGNAAAADRPAGGKIASAGVHDTRSVRRDSHGFAPLPTSSAVDHASLMAGASVAVAGRTLPASRSAANTAPPTARNGSRHTNARFSLDDDEAGEEEMIIRDQDQSLDDLAVAVHRIGSMGKEMHEELQQHSVLLDDIESTMDNTSSRMQSIHRKLDDFIAQTSKGQLCTIVCLFFLFILLTFLVIAT